MPRNKVFLDYDQKALDDAYDQAVYALNRDQILARSIRNSELARKRLGAPLRFGYGPSNVEQLDLYTSSRSSAPINIYVHGGAWRSRRASEYGFAAEMFVQAGAHFVVPDFCSVLDAGGSLFPMIEQVRRAVAWVYQNAIQFGGNPDELYVSGSSSGAHLVAVVATTEWEDKFDLPWNVVKGYTLISGMYDLRGPRLSKRSEYVKFTDEMEEALSPQRNVSRIRAPIVLIYGSLETPEFQRQSRDFARALEQAGKEVELILAEGYNHFEIAETMGNPYGAAGRALLGQMHLPPFSRIG
jgi:arylformamidase